MKFDLEKRAKPVLKWAGGKSALLPQLIAHFPLEFERLIEPFAGGAAVSLALDSRIPTILNDTNTEIINLYEVIRDFPEVLMSNLDSMVEKYCEDFFYSLRSETPTDKIDKAARTVFLNKTGFNGLYRQNSKGGFNVPFGKRSRCPALFDRRNFLQVSRRFASLELSNSDFETVIAGAEKGDFVYCDPPYEPLSVTSSFNSYTGSGFDRKEQIRLRDVCVAAARRGVTVAVSNSSAEFIKTIYQENDIRFIAAKRAINSKGSARGSVEEVLVLL